MISSKRSIEIEFQWLVSVYSPKVIEEIKTILNTALDACGIEIPTDKNVNLHPFKSSEIPHLFPSANIILRGNDKDTYCDAMISGDRILKAVLQVLIVLHLSVSGWNHNQSIILKSNPAISLFLEQVFNAGNLIFLAIELLNNSHIPKSGSDDFFERSSFFSNLYEIKRLLARSVQQLVDVEQQNIFPYTVFDSATFLNAPDDIVLEFFLQNGKICSNIYIIAPASHQSPIHAKQKSLVNQSAHSSGISFNQVANCFYFYNGAPIEVMFFSKLEALLPSAVTTLNSVELAIGLIDDLCEKIECIKQLLDSF